MIVALAIAMSFADPKQAHSTNAYDIMLISYFSITILVSIFLLTKLQITIHTNFKGDLG